MTSPHERDFLAAWQAGRTPRIPEFLPVDDSRFMTLVALIKIDLDQRWSRGTPKRVEEYYAELPDLAACGGIPCELIFEEYQARRRYGTTASISEYVERFPDQATDFARMLDGTVPEPAGRRVVLPPRLAAGMALDDFDLLALVGEGSFAQVFLARQRSMQRLVALKISADTGSEPQTLAQLDHPHIVRVYDQRVLDERGLRLLYMPYLAGGTLRDVIQRVRSTPPDQRTGQLLIDMVDAALARRGEVPPTDSVNRTRLAAMTWPQAVCWIGARLAEALDYAHRIGVLHRDVKPANVLLGADAAPRLADFNVSSASSLIVPADSFGGSVAYMSPEQLEAFDANHPRKPDSLDGRSDLYSLAITLWELLTGERPFRDPAVSDNWSTTIAALHDQRQQGVTEDAKQRLPENLPPGLDEILINCLQADPERRPARAAAVARQLDLCLKPRARELLIPKPGWRTWVARHPVLSLISAGLVPNVLASWFNIEYNRAAIVEPYPAVRETFQLLQIIVNGTFFPICIALFAYFLWPVVRGLNRLRRGSFPEAELAPLRRRTLRLGPISVIVCVWAWIAAGVIFPLVMHWTVHELPPAVHLHFLISQTLSGLVAVTYPQFGVTFLSLRGLYPRFVSDATFTAADVAQWRTLDREQHRYLLLAATIPMLAVGMLAGFGGENRITLAAISAIAMVGFGVAFALTAAIRRDLEALQELS